MPGKEKVSPEEILKTSGAEHGAVKLEPSLRARGMKLVAGVGGLAVVATFFIVGKWIWMAPNAPQIPSGSSPADAAQIIANYKSLHEIALSDATQLFETIVIKVLLPVFTSILGYIFGSKNDAK